MTDEERGLVQTDEHFEKAIKALNIRPNPDVETVWEVSLV